MAPARLSFELPEAPIDDRFRHSRSRGRRAPDRSRPFTTSDTTRSRRFALPELDDARADAAIDAFLAGPQARRGRRDAGASTGRAAGDRLAVALESRVDWNRALLNESARSQRYRRPASVVVIRAEVRPGAEDELALSRLAGPIGHAIRRGARDIDHVTRAAEGRFQVLLPETSEDEAAQFAERVVADCEIWLHATGGPVLLRTAVGSATGDRTLESALESAIEALGSD
jgi:hypothetical protein